MRKGHNRLRILALAIENAVLTNTVLDEALGIDGSTYLLTTMAEEQLLKEDRLKFYAGKKGRVVSKRIYTITNKGFQYLLSNGISYLPWLQDYDIQNKKFIFRGQTYRKNRILRYANEAIANIFLANCGVTTFPLYITPPQETTKVIETEEGKETPVNNLDSYDDLEGYDELDADNYHYLYKENDNKNDNEEEQLKIEDGERDFKNNAVELFSVISKAEAVKRFSKYKNSKIRDNYIFATRNTIRRLGNRNTSEKILSVNFTNNVGILCKDNTSLLVYVSSSEGLPWNKRDIGNELAQKTAFDIEHDVDKTKETFPKSGILLLKNEKMFANVFLDKALRRTDSCELGYGLDALYVIPMNQNGKNHLYFLLEENQIIYRRDTIKAAVNSGVFIPNKNNMEIDDIYFRLIEKQTGAYCAYGLDMNIVAMNQWMRIMKEHPDEKYKIICFDWQVLYYQTVFDCEYITVNT